MMEEIAKHEQTSNKCEVPIWIKQNLTLEEAVAYFGIGQTKIKQMTNSEDCPFVLWNGTKRLVKRKKMEEYLDNLYSL